MKLIIVIATCFCLMAPTSSSAGRVRGYTDKNGRYVPPHNRTNPDKRKDNNYGSAPNVNPYTGKQGKD